MLREHADSTRDRVLRRIEGTRGGDAKRTLATPGKTRTKNPFVRSWSGGRAWNYLPCECGGDDVARRVLAGDPALGVRCEDGRKVRAPSMVHGGEWWGWKW